MNFEESLCVWIPVGITLIAAAYVLGPVIFEKITEFLDNKPE